MRLLDQLNTKKNNEKKIVEFIIEVTKIIVVTVPTKSVVELYLASINLHYTKHQSKSDPSSAFFHPVSVEI